MRELTEATRSARQLAALRLLDEHGGLDADAATDAVWGALCRRCTPAVVQMLLGVSAGFEFVVCSALDVVRRADVARQLNAAGADVNARDRLRSSTPLLGLLGGYQGNENSEQLEVAKVLIAAGADVNAVNSEGEPCLFNAVFVDFCSRRLRSFPLLLDAGADPTIIRYDGSTWLDHTIARMQFHIGAALSAAEGGIGLWRAILAFIAGAADTCFWQSAPATAALATQPRAPLAVQLRPD